MIKAIVLTVLFVICSSSCLFSDDSTYYSYGDNLYPVQNSKIDLTYEKLDFKLKNGLNVSAYLEFTNNYDEQELLIGFETPAQEVDDPNSKEDRIIIPQSGIKDFKVYFNDSPLKYNLAITNKKIDFSNIDYEDINGLLGLDLLMDAGFIIDLKNLKIFKED